MKPLTVLIGIVMGSLVSTSVALCLTLAVFLLLPEFRERAAHEQGPLLVACALILAAAVSSGYSFYGELRARAWRWWAHFGLLLMLVAIGAAYWPRE
ncbi:MAG TPA: hypothetical protein P5528_14325 [Steroidobacteraceae bacterium]|nr:hypothetical protein [Steroidobacteraceae bacterium]